MSQSEKVGIVKAKRKKKSIGDLDVNWSVNPRNKSELLITEYAESLDGYIKAYDENQDGSDIATYIERCWDQKFEITEDSIVVKGCHSILALQKILEKKMGSEDGIKFKIWVNIHPVSGEGDAKYLSAQSNRHGKDLDKGEKRKAVEFILQATNKTKYNTDTNLKPFLVQSKIASMAGCSRQYVQHLRDEYVHGKPEETNNEKIQRISEEKNKLEKQMKEQGVSVNEISDKDISNAAERAMLDAKSDPDFSEVVDPDIFDENQTSNNKSSVKVSSSFIDEDDDDSDGDNEVDIDGKLMSKQSIKINFRKNILKLHNELLKVSETVDFANYQSAIMVVKELTSKHLEQVAIQLDEAQQRSDENASRSREIFSVLTKIQDVFADSILELTEALNLLAEVSDK